GAGTCQIRVPRSHFRCNRLGVRKTGSCPPSPKSCGTLDRSQKSTGPFMKRSSTRTCTVGTWLWSRKLSQPGAHTEDAGALNTGRLVKWAVAGARR
ncbi:unnamed protein product, partial [Staurois parvus]